MTNSTAYLIEQLDPTERAALLRRLFAPDQANLSFIRVPMGGSDFNEAGIRYSEDDLPLGRSDPGLIHFSLQHDWNMVRVMREVVSINPHIRVLVSPWSAPAWMKTNDSLTNRYGAGFLRAKDYGPYARYFVKFIQAYERAGIPIFGMTVQNEPTVPASYEGMDLPPASEGYFVRRFLRPALRRAGIVAGIYGTDMSWDGGPYTHRALSAAGGLAGVAWHCYTGNPDLTMARFTFMAQLVSECAPNLIASPPAALAANTMNDGASAVVLWNLALTPDGGPVVWPNSNCHGCQGVVSIDLSSHRVTYSSDYYQLAQFGRFLRPGARRIAVTRLGHYALTPGTDRASPGLQDVGWRNRDGTDVLAVFNNDYGEHEFSVVWRGASFSYQVPGKATSTFAWSELGSTRRG